VAVRHRKAETAAVRVGRALTRNWSAKLEYDFMDFGTSRFNFDLTGLAGSSGAVLTTDIKQQIQTVKFGLNYKFDWSGPISASR
jgi:outer membrane immunogenic protein